MIIGHVGILVKAFKLYGTLNCFLYLYFNVNQIQNAPNGIEACLNFQNAPAKVGQDLPPPPPPPPTSLRAWYMHQDLMLLEKVH